MRTLIRRARACPDMVGVQVARLRYTLFLVNHAILSLLDYHSNVDFSISEDGYYILVV